MKWLFLSMIVLCYGVSYAQTVKVLTLRQKKYFKERDQFNSDSTLYILCEVCYDEPNTIDEEHCHSITITVKDKPAFYEAAVLDIEKDTSIIKCNYDRLSVWNWGELKNKITGTIKIISFTDDTIKLDMDVLVSAKEKYIYKGSRVFKRTKGRL